MRSCPLWSPEAPNALLDYTQSPPFVTYSSWIFLTCIFLLTSPQVSTCLGPVYFCTHLSFLPLFIFWANLLPCNLNSDTFKKIYEFAVHSSLFVDVTYGDISKCHSSYPPTLQSRNQKYSHWNSKVSQVILTCIQSWGSLPFGNNLWSQLCSSCWNISTLPFTDQTVTIFKIVAGDDF